MKASRRLRTRLVLGASLAISVLGVVAGASAFDNLTTISIPDGSCTAPCTTPGLATPYPSPITVSGQSGNIGSVTVTLHQYTPTGSNTNDHDILLVGPTNAKVILMSDTGLTCT